MNRNKKMALIIGIVIGILLLLILIFAYRLNRKKDLFQEKQEPHLVDQSEQEEVNVPGQEVQKIAWETISNMKKLPSATEIPDPINQENAIYQENNFLPEKNQEQESTGVPDQLNTASVTNSEKEGGAEEVLAQEDSIQFSSEIISEEIKQRINGKSYGKNCDVPYDELRYVKVMHYGFDGEVHQGELIVNKAIAGDIIDIFKELYELKYPIERMVLVDEYDADDNASMADNNSSAFNYRNIDGTDRVSNHSFGTAIDINPLYNPYVRNQNGKQVVTPENGKKYADRSLDCPYYIDTEDPCYKAFISRGFTWGGSWKNSKDYQHFEKKPN
ncbi:M15 family metallopeptidase [Variimorphobacter saccharofermentans]|nr:M15 family metallopeptidase [Variimorphobacter saccharofermentans]